MLWFKKLKVPTSNEQVEIDVVQLWRVEWWSRHGEFIGGTPKWCEAIKQVECFTSDKGANDFADSLRNAFKLLKYTGNGLDIKVSKN